MDEFFPWDIKIKLNKKRAPPSFRYAIKDGVLVAFFIAQMTQTQEEHDMFRNKPTVGSVCEGMCRALPFASVIPERHKAQTTISGCSFPLA